MGDIIDGKLYGFKDVSYSSQRATVSAQWRNFRDPESKIIDYEAQVEVSP
jgi:capsid protein